MSYQILDNRDIDQVYSPESEKAQSGKALVEPLLYKANLETKEIQINNIEVVLDLKDENYIYHLSEINYRTNELIFLEGTTLTTEELDLFEIGKKYLIKGHFYDDGVSYAGWFVDAIFEVIDLDDKANIDETITLEYKSFIVNDFQIINGGIKGKKIYTLKNIEGISEEEVLEGLLIFDNDCMIQSINVKSIEELNALGFIIGRKYEIDLSLDSNNELTVINSFKVIIDLKDKVNIEDIDQTYVPESPNAQSGKAVAEAFENQKVILLDHTLTEEQAGARHLSFALNAEQAELLIKAKTLNMHLSFPCENETVSGSMCVRMYVGDGSAYAYYFYQSYFAYAEGKTVDCAGTTLFYDFDRLYDGDRSFQTLISNGNPYYGNSLNNYGNASGMMGYIRPSNMRTYLPSIQISNDKIPFKAGTKIYWEARL